MMSLVSNGNSSNGIVHFLGKKWVTKTILLIEKRKSLGFNEIKKELEDITSTRLSSVLKELEKFKMVERRVFHNSPIHTNYILTEKGKEIITKIKDLT